MIVIGLVASPSAYAARLYWELGMGAGWIKSSSSLLSNTESLSIGTLLSLGLGITSASDSRESSIQFAVQGRSVSGSSSSQHFTLLTAYPILRLTTRRLSLELGASPIVYTRIAPYSGISSFSPVTGAIAAMGGFAYETILNPQASILWNAGVQGYRYGGVFSPWPIYEAGLNLRIFIGGSETFSKTERSIPTGDDYRGWRYPFGRGH